MNNKVFYGIITLLIIGLIGFVAFSKDDSTRPKARLGQEQPDKGQDHVAPGTAKYTTPFPTSGPHTQPVPWQAYQQEVPDENLIHNMEHGGVIVTYSPSLPTDVATKLEKLFSKPYVKSNFKPSKAIVAPNSKNDKPIIIRSWNRLMKLDSYDEQTLINYYLTNVNKSPEAAAS